MFGGKGIKFRGRGNNSTDILVSSPISSRNEAIPRIFGVPESRNIFPQNFDSRSIPPLCTWNLNSLIFFHFLAKILSTKIFRKYVETKIENILPIFRKYVARISKIVWVQKCRVWKRGRSSMLGDFILHQQLSLQIWPWPFSLFGKNMSAKILCNYFGNN